ncbi:MAG: SDR family oxidoreductase [Gemmataceae bacterium]
MRRDFTARRILITGASGGIGRELAVQLSRAGARLALFARSEDKLREVAASLPGESLVIPGDVTKDEDRRRAIADVQEKLGGLDVLINNAGVASWAHFADSSEEIMRYVMEVCYFAPVELIRLAIPLLTEGVQPAIVNVSSMCGRRAMPGWSEYSAAKHALCGFTEAMRGELARFDVDTLLIVPGLTKSEFQKHFLQAKGRANIQFHKGMPPEKVAARIIKSLRKSKTETVMGREARWVLWFNKLFPRLTDWLLARKMKQLYKEAPPAR